MIILLLVVSVCVLSGDYDYILVINTEGHLIRYGMLICWYDHQWLAAGFFPVPDNHLALTIAMAIFCSVCASQSSNSDFLLVRREASWYKLLCCTIVRCQHLLSLRVLMWPSFDRDDSLQIIDNAQGMLRFFTNSKEPSWRTYCQAGYPFRALNSGNEDLGLIIDTVYNDIMSACVDYMMISDVVHVIPDTAIDTVHEAGHHGEASCLDLPRRDIG
jgi:hypothetical protein